MTTGYVALYTLSGDGLGIASAATDVSLANRNLALGTGSLTATNLTGTLQTAAQTNITSLGTLTSLSISPSSQSVYPIVITRNYASIPSLPTSSDIAGCAITVSYVNDQATCLFNTGRLATKSFLVLQSAGVPDSYSSVLEIMANGDAYHPGTVFVETITQPTLNTKMTLFSSTQNRSRLTFSGQEFYQAANTSQDGPAFVLGVNRTNNRQLWLVDSANASLATTTNYMIRFNVGSTLAAIDALSTDGVTSKQLTLGNSGGGAYFPGNVGIGITPSASCYLNIGNSVLNGANANEVRLGVTSASSAYRAGQSGTNHAYFAWSYNATPASAYVEIGTWGNSNLVRIGGSSLELTSGGTTRVTVDSSGNTTMTGNLRVGTSYANLSLTGGNSTGHLYGAFAAFGDAIHIGYNYYHNNTTGIIPNTGGGTTRFTMGFNSFIWSMGAVNTAPTTTVLTIDSSGHLVPGAHNTYDLGTTGTRWRDAWVQRAAFNGSDERVKTRIQPTRFGLDFVRKLQPVSWQWKDTSGDDTALHHGFIAQQVKQVLTDLGATNKDFGGYHDPEDRKQSGFLALAYNEFISPVVAAVQELDNRGFVETRPAPETSTSPGQRGEFRSTDQYLFACVGENQWKRVAWDQAVW